MAKPPEDKQPTTVSLEQAAALVGMSTRWVNLRAKDGYFKAETRGRYALVPFVRGVVAYYESRLETANKSAAASRATDARTKEIELRIAEREGKLIPREDAETVVSSLAAFVRTELGGLAASATRDLALRKAIDAEVHGVIDRIRDHARKSGEALRSGRVDMDAESSSDAE